MIERVLREFPEADTRKAGECVLTDASGHTLTLHTTAAGVSMSLDHRPVARFSHDEFQDLSRVVTAFCAGRLLVEVGVSDGEYYRFDGDGVRRTVPGKLLRGLTGLRLRQRLVVTGPPRPIVLRLGRESVLGWTSLAVMGFVAVALGGTDPGPLWQVLPLQASGLAAAWWVWLSTAHECVVIGPDGLIVVTTALRHDIPWSEVDLTWTVEDRLHIRLRDGRVLTPEAAQGALSGPRHGRDRSRMAVVERWRAAARPGPGVRRVVDVKHWHYLALVACAALVDLLA
ncbi:hypothetical protein Acsp05_01810 [Actinokineospora sp. NBRC 105648]|nr:hypothetical protein Acsp05_01810 [Actinokineospora sp. NBRC 105648]